MKFMKKTVTIVLSLLMVLSFAACGNSEDRTGQASAENRAESSEVAAAAAENTDTPESQPESSEEQPEETGASDPEGNSVQSEESSPAEPEENEEEQTVQGGRVLVAYFSATNTTEGVAEHIAAGLNADIYEIVPEEPYTDADLNYNDNNSRSTIEMNDPAARPAISGSVEDMDQYSIVFVGYPNWWYTAPMAVFSFLEDNDLAGKRVVLFCSHGTGGLASSVKDITTVLPDSDIEENVLGIYRDDIVGAEDELAGWLAELGL